MFRILVVLITLWTSAGSESTDYINGEKCSVYYTLGYKYIQWFNATPNDAVDVVNNKSDVLLKFYVRGSSNAHIMLSADPPSFGYEIVLGGGANTFCEIRKSNRLTSVVTVPLSKVLSLINPTGFWIHVFHQTGMIEVGRYGEDLPFMFWVDPTPLPVKYFSFSSWDGVVSKWLYKCHPASEKADSDRQFLTYMERLRRDVLKKRGTFAPGNQMTNVQQLLNVAITSNFKYIHLDVMTSTLTLRGVAIFEWMDNGIQWNPSDYKNISKLHLSDYELWRPELILHNALNPAVGMFSESKISVDNNGKVIWRPKFDVKTNCDIDVELWPWDQHKCTVLLSTWSHKISNIFYEIKENNKPECFHVAHSDWKLKSMTSSYIEDNTPWDDILASVNDDNGSDNPKQVSLQLVVEISRNTKIFETLFYTPLILISCLWLSSFCIMPNSTSKITIICISVLLSTLVTVYMTKYVPIFIACPPKLILGYLKLMLLISTDAFISSFLITIHSRKTTSGHPPFALTRLLTTPVVTRILVLPKLGQLQTSEEYNQLQDDKQTKGELETSVTLWDIIIVAFERIVFVTYCVITLSIVLSSVNVSPF